MRLKRKRRRKGGFKNDPLAVLSTFYYEVSFFVNVCLNY
jgi:hypothetical protein